MGTQTSICELQDSRSSCDGSGTCSFCRAFPQNLTYIEIKVNHKKHPGTYTPLEPGFPLLSSSNHVAHFQRADVKYPVTSLWIPWHSKLPPPPVDLLETVNCDSLPDPPMLPQPAAGMQGGCAAPGGGKASQHAPLPTARLPSSTRQ